MTELRVTFLGFVLPDDEFRELVSLDEGMPVQTQRFGLGLVQALQEGGATVSLISPGYLLKCSKFAQQCARQRIPHLDSAPRSRCSFHLSPQPGMESAIPRASRAICVPEYRLLEASRRVVQRRHWIPWTTMQRSSISVQTTESVVTAVKQIPRSSVLAPRRTIPTIR